jgi:hypothetical protein
MTDVILSIQKAILQYIDISTFSDDLRLLILDYMHPRIISLLTCEGMNYSFRLSPYLENKQLSLCIIICCHHLGISRIISSFGIYCEEKAIHEYNTFNTKITRISPHEIFLKPIDFVAEGDFPDGSLLYKSLYAFCKDDKSTVMFQVQKRKYLTTYKLKYYTTTDNITMFDAVNNCYGVRYHWKAGSGSYEYYRFEDAIEKMVEFYQLVMTWGSKWHERADEPKFWPPPEIVHETFCTDKHTITIKLD